MARKRTNKDDYDPLVGITSNFFEQDDKEEVSQDIVIEAPDETPASNTIIEADEREEDIKVTAKAENSIARSKTISQSSRDQITAKIVYTKAEYDSNKEIAKILGNRIGNQKINQSEITRALWNILKHVQEKIEEIPQSKINEVPTAPRWDSVAQGEREEAITTLLMTIIKSR